MFDDVEGEGAVAAAAALLLAAAVKGNDNIREIE